MARLYNVSPAHDLPRHRRSQGQTGVSGGVSAATITMVAELLKYTVMCDKRLSLKYKRANLWKAIFFFVFSSDIYLDRIGKCIFRFPEVPITQG